MTDLTPVGLSKDGSSLILVSNRGIEFTVLVDQRLRAALRGDNTRLVQLEKSMESTLRPRDVQTRIRAGASVEEVAAAAGTTVERLLVFAGPVIAEREHVATLAQKASLRRTSAERATSARTLEESSLPHLRSVNVIPDDVRWDSWRREDGRWTVVAEYDVADSVDHVVRAVFTYDVHGRYVTADNEEAQYLTGEREPGTTQQPIVETVETSQEAAVLPPLANSGIVLGRPSPSDVPLGDDAIDLVNAAATSSAPGPFGRVEDEPASLFFDTPLPEEERPRTTSAPPQTPHQPKRHAKKPRPAVPSWDEIMFGGKDD